MKASFLLLSTACVGILWSSFFQNCSAKDALHLPDGVSASFTGYAKGGAVGWSFVPRVDLTLTEAGYVDLGGSKWEDAVVCVWAGTNGPIATYTNLATPEKIAPIELLYAPVSPLTLTAGQEYRLTLHWGPWPSTYESVVLVQAPRLGECDGDSYCSRFIPAPEIHFLNTYLFADNAFRLFPEPPFNGTNVYLGPTFRFEVAAPEKPRLQVLRDGPGLVLTWPVASTIGIEVSESLTATNWLAVTNAVVISRDTCVLTNSLSDGARFFRLRVR